MPTPETPQPELQTLESGYRMVLPRKEPSKRFIDTFYMDVLGEVNKFLHAPGRDADFLCITAGCSDEQEFARRMSENLALVFVRHSLQWAAYRADGIAEYFYGDIPDLVNKALTDWEEKAK